MLRVIDPRSEKAPGRPFPSVLSSPTFNYTLQHNAFAGEQVAFPIEAAAEATEAVVRRQNPVAWD